MGNIVLPSHSRRDALELHRATRPDQIVALRVRPQGRFVPHLASPLPTLHREALPLLPEPTADAPDQTQNVTRALERLHTEVLPALLRTEVREVAVRRTEDVATREAAGSQLDDVPDAFRRVLLHALEVFRDPTSGAYHPGAVRTLNVRLYHWLSVQGAKGAWTPERVKTVLRYLRLVVDDHGRPRPWVERLVRRHLPLLEWAERRWGARLFPTDHGDAAEWTDFISSADCEPAQRTDRETAFRIGTAVAALPRVALGDLAGPVEVCWRARVCVLEPMQWWALMLRCEEFVEAVERSDVAWDDLAWSARPLPQTAVLRRMFGRNVTLRALFPPSIEKMMHPQWKRPSSRVLFVLSHVLAVLEECETLREATARGESNAQRYQSGPRYVETVSPAVAERSTALSDRDWDNHVRTSKQTFPYAWQPPFLAYVQSCKIARNGPEFAPQLLQFADWAVLPLILGREPDPRCKESYVGPILRQDHAQCVAWDEDTRWRRAAPQRHVPVDLERRLHGRTPYDLKEHDWHDPVIHANLWGWEDASGT